VARFIANSVELASKNSFEVLVAHQTALCPLKKNPIFRRVRVHSSWTFQTSSAGAPRVLPVNTGSIRHGPVHYKHHHIKLGDYHDDIIVCCDRPFRNTWIDRSAIEAQGVQAARGREAALRSATLKF